MHPASILVCDGYLLLLNADTAKRTSINFETEIVYKME